MFDKNIKKVLKNIPLGSDGIWGELYDYGEQNVEKEFRELVARQHYPGYLLEIARHHSIPVMDREVEKFLSLVPSGGLVLDVGGCWGWHWRKIGIKRPDITLFIVDLVRENLLHAKEILNELVYDEKVFLVHGNACSLEFDNHIFDGVWSVQASQHIPDFSNMCAEVFRVLKSQGVYWDYGLNNASLVHLVYKILRRNYHLDGVMAEKFFLRRVNDNVVEIVKQTFNAEPVVRYSEILFTPDFGLPIGGKENSLLGRADCFFTGSCFLLKILARQCSFHVQKHM